VHNTWCHPRIVELFLTQPCYGLSKVKLATVTFVTQQQRMHNAVCVG